MNNEEKKLPDEKAGRFFFRASAADFKKIPGSPIAYTVSQNVIRVFCDFPALSLVAEKRLGLCTGNNDDFIRAWTEVDYKYIGFDRQSNQDFIDSGFRYAPHNKGGETLKWYGNQELVIKFDKQSFDNLSVLCNRLASRSRYFQECITWSEIGTNFSVRVLPRGFVFNIKGPSIFAGSANLLVIAAHLNSNSFSYLLKLISQTMSFNGGEVERIPVCTEILKSEAEVVNKSRRCLDIASFDYASRETSWDFKSLSLLQFDYRQSTLQATYNNLRAHWHEITLEMQRLEEGNNRIFIDAYGLRDELTPEVPLNEITLTCNPHYRYSNNKNREELEAMLLADTMKEFISYAVGCMFGRYGLNASGLILANQGEGLEDYYRIASNQLSVISNQQEEKAKGSELKADYCPLMADSFLPDEDNVIPILDGDWFTDDISERFRKFLRITFGEEHYEENLKFIEVALGKDIRKYFLKDFYNDHVKRYKKRPIYWLFSSPKGSFNALIYMHRYRPDTASVVLNGYLREFRTKLLSRKSQLEAVSISASASPGEKTKALKEIESLRKMIEELESYERDVLYPLATEQIAIDLDDGVKVNYQKFGPALKKILGLDSKEE